jgi:SsrA-binding protein
MDIIATNRQAHFKYAILEKYEAGLVLKGSEVKSLRNKDASLNEAFAQVRDDEFYLYGLHIGPYKQAHLGGHEPKRPRKLLLKKIEISKIVSKVSERGCTLVPLALYFNKRGIVKVEIAVAKGKQLHDKRETIRKRETTREIQRAMKR